MLSPVNKSRMALVKPMPGISVIILPITTLSTLVIHPSSTVKKAHDVIMTVAKNLLKILLEIIFSEKNKLNRTIAPINKEIRASIIFPPKNSVNAPAITAQHINSN